MFSWPGSVGKDGPLDAPLTLDAAAFALLGPTPCSLLGAAATFGCWSRRGSLASALPYKATFSLYALGAAANLYCSMVSAEGDRCTLPHGRSLITTALVNSSLLATVRF